MIYVKTKDAIYECYADASLEEINNAYADDVVIAKADNIEELCDAIVVKYVDEYFPRVIDMYRVLESCKSVGITLQEHVHFLLDEMFSAKLEYVVAAIWYDEGNLKAVAKFNEQVELKLI